MSLAMGLTLLASGCEPLGIGAAAPPPALVDPCAGWEPDEPSPAEIDVMSDQRALDLDQHRQWGEDHACPGSETGDR